MKLTKQQQEEIEVLQELITWPFLYRTGQLHLLRDLSSSYPFHFIALMQQHKGAIAPHNLQRLLHRLAIIEAQVNTNQHVK